MRPGGSRPPRRTGRQSPDGEGQRNRSAGRPPRSCRPSTTSTPATSTSRAKPPPLRDRAARRGGGRGRTSENGFVQVVVLADTHAPRRWRVGPPRVAEHLRLAELLLHAGHDCIGDVLAELAEYAPVTAVLGNNDGSDVAGLG